MEIILYIVLAVVCFCGGYYMGKEKAPGLSESETDAIRQVLAVLSFRGDENENQN